ncbi:MAG: lysoplasmalogenase [Woeseiaceae bacterium]
MTLINTRTFVVLVMTACVVSVVMLLVGQDIAAAAAKVVASSSFVALAISAGSLRSTYGRIILLGLSFSWLGDALLIGKTQTMFLLGLGAFLLAHIAYIAAFAGRGTNVKWAGAAALAIVPIAIGVSLWLTPHVPNELIIPVRTYTVVISLMVLAAFATHGRHASVLIFTGALLFFLSDLSVATLRLVQTDFPNYVWGLPSYYAGQVCLAVSTSQSRSHGGTPENRSARKSINARTR